MQTSTKNFPLVSTLVPCYNHENYVEQSIRSALEQTYPNLELIVIDDGSKDSTSAKIENLLKTHKFSFERQSNMGHLKTLNKALSKSSGKYIALLASDDYWHPEKIQKQVELLEKNPELGLVYSYAVEVTDDGAQHRTLGEPHFGRAFDKLFRSNFISAPTIVIRRDVLLEIGGFNTEYLAEDFFLLLRIAKKYPIASVNEVLAYYRISMNFISKNHRKMMESEQKIIAHFKGEPAYQREIYRWRARWFNTLSGQFKKESILFLFQNFNVKMIRYPSFWKGLGKLILKWG